MAESGRVTVGLSEIWVGQYNNNAGAVTYSNGFKLGRAVSWEISPETGNDNIFYADNKGAEDLGGTVASGDTTIEIDGLLFESANKLAGITPESGRPAVYTNAAKPFWGVGGIVKRLSGGEITYQAIILHKVKFNTAGTSATTQGETMEAQTQELAGRFFPDDTTAAAWKTVYRDAGTEAAALAFIKDFLSIQ